MNSNPDRIDDAIDRVAARMTNVTEDNGLAMRIANALPERSQWLPFGWISRVTVGALATGAIIVVLRTFDESSTTVLRTEVATAPSLVAERSSNDRRTMVEPPVIVRRTSVERPLNVARTKGEADSSDFERSLAAIDAPNELAIGALAPSGLASDAPLEVAPLAIAELPLTADFSPR
jgi:hypothetical protein